VKARGERFRSAKWSTCTAVSAIARYSAASIPASPIESSSVVAAQYRHLTSRLGSSISLPFSE